MPLRALCVSVRAHLRVLRASACYNLRALAVPFSALSIITARASAPPQPMAEPGSVGVDTARHRIRVNQIGYLPDAPKVAVLCALEPRAFEEFHVVDHRTGRRVLGPLPVKAGGAFGPCVEAYRLDFTELRAEGEYRLVAGTAVSPRVRVGRDVYRGTADVLLAYLRQQ